MLVINKKKQKKQTTTIKYQKKQGRTKSLCYLYDTAFLSFSGYYLEKRSMLYSKSYSKRYTKALCFNILLFQGVREETLIN